MSYSQSRRLLLVCASAFLLLVVFPFVSVESQSTFCAPLSDPYPTSYRAIASSATSTALSYVFMGNVIFYDTTPNVVPTAPSASTMYSTTSLACSSVTVPVGHPNAGNIVTANPMFAKTLATNANIVAVGNPNRDTTFYAPSPSTANGPVNTYASASYSSIDILTMTGTTRSATTTIEDFNSPMLGSITSMAQDATSLASLYDPTTVVVYSPLTGRKKSYYNNGGGASNDFDSKITLPATFAVDSISLKGQSILVSGFDVQGSACFPSVRLYSQTGAANAGGAWSLVSSSPLRRVNAVIDFSNAHPCPAARGLPAGMLPVALSDDLSSFVVGSRLLSTVWSDSVSTLSTSSSRFLFEANSNSHKGGFGTHVDFLAPDGSEFNVFSAVDNLVYSFTRSTWNTVAAAPAATFSSMSPAGSAKNIFPNKLQQRLDDGFNSATFVQFASTANGLYILTAPNLASSRTSSVITAPIFALPETAVGHFYNTLTNTIDPCPAGSYKNTVDNDACTLCPAGTFSSTTGSVSCTWCNSSTPATGFPYYCPTGATSQLTQDIYQSETPEYLIPFEPEGAGELFEELLVNTVFTRYSRPMIIFYVIMFSTLGLIFIYWCPYTPQKIKTKTLQILLLYQYLSMQNEKEQKREELEKQVKKHLIKYPSGCAPGAESPFKPGSMRALHHAASQRNLPQGSSSEDLLSKGHAQADSPSGVAPPLARRMTEAELREAAKREQEEEEEELEELFEKEHHADHIVCAGFFKLILVMFCMSSILFSIIFLSSYDWIAAHGPYQDPINRFTEETVGALAAAEDYEARGLNVLALTNATLSIDLFGFSGAACDATSVQSLVFDGCTLLDSPLKCNDTSFVFVEANNADEVVGTQTNVCSFLLRVPTQSNFVGPLTFSLVLPPSVHVSAARFSYLQDPVMAGIAKDGTDDSGNYEIGATRFRETVTHPWQYNINPLSGAITMQVEDNYLRSPVIRNWDLGTLINKHQDNIDTPIHYYEHMFNTIKVTSLNEFFAPFSETQYLKDTTTNNLEFRVVITQDTYMRIQTTQRLIQPGVAFLTIVLGLIGIYHMVIFGQEMCELAWFSFKKIRVYSMHASNKVAALVGVDLNLGADDHHHGGAGGDGKPGETSPNAHQRGLSSGKPLAVHAKIEEGEEHADSSRRSRNGGDRAVPGTGSGRIEAFSRPAPAGSNQYLAANNNSPHPLGVDSSSAAGSVNNGQVQMTESVPKHHSNPSSGGGAPATQAPPTAVKMSSLSSNSSSDDEDDSPAPTPSPQATAPLLPASDLPNPKRASGTLPPMTVTPRKVIGAVKPAGNSR